MIFHEVILLYALSLFNLYIITMQFFQKQELLYRFYKIDLQSTSSIHIYILLAISETL